MWLLISLFTCNRLSLIDSITSPMSVPSVFILEVPRRSAKLPFHSHELWHGLDSRVTSDPLGEMTVCVSTIHGRNTQIEPCGALTTTQLCWLPYWMKSHLKAKVPPPPPFSLLNTIFLQDMGAAVAQWLAHLPAYRSFVQNPTEVQVPSPPPNTMVPIFRLGWSGRLLVSQKIILTAHRIIS